MRTRARKAFLAFIANPDHPSLRFGKLKGDHDYWSVRFGDGYRAVGQRTGDTVLWLWSGLIKPSTKLSDPCRTPETLEPHRHAPGPRDHPHHRGTSAQSVAAHHRLGCGLTARRRIKQRFSLASPRQAFEFRLSTLSTAPHGCGYREGLSSERPK
ncbi:MAG: hypothetical protein ACR2ID_04380 [Chthoniobacterales bacterium]